MKLANLLAPELHQAYLKIAQYLTVQLGSPIAFQGDAKFQALRNGTVDLACICCLPYTVLRDESSPALEPLVAPLLLDTRGITRPVYFTDLVVSKESKVSSIDDLRGMRFAFNEQISFSGYIAVQHGLAEHGVGLSDFVEQKQTGFHSRSLERVAEGEAEVAGIDSHLLWIKLKQDSALEDQIQVLASFGPFPMPPVVCTENTSHDVRKSLEEAFLTMHHDDDLQKLLRSIGISCFHAVDDSDYDEVRAIAKKWCPEITAADFL